MCGEYIMEMGRMNLKDIIGETTDYDKKLALEVKKPKSWCKSVSAFANGVGGTLFGLEVKSPWAYIGLEKLSK